MTDDELCALYRDEKLTTTNISKQYNIPYPTLRKRIRKLGIARRDQYDQKMYLSNGEWIKIYHKEYRAWQKAKSRCYCLSDEKFYAYGGRGIKMCDSWRESFVNFFNDMGETDRMMSLDRIDVNGNYEPSNCRWATQKEQQNNRRNNVRIDYRGQNKTLAQWAEHFGLTKSRFFVLHFYRNLSLPEIESRYAQ